MDKSIQPSLNNLSANTYLVFDSALSKEFCKFVLSELDWSTSEVAATNHVGGPLINEELRRTDIIWQDFMQPLGCLTKTYVEFANQSANWNYVLNGQEPTQLGRYKSSDEGHYDWHVDISPEKNGTQRKLSVGILLSDPSEFEGGEFQIKGMEDEKILTKQGSIVVFPSFIEHRVTPVTKGVRYSAVTWFRGPSFR
jgi:PKHD-type hydroxylase